MSDFGAGPFLDRELDFEVTTTGDIRTVSGIDELEKDVALQHLIQLAEFEGYPIRPSTETRIKAATRDILNEDPRINSIVSVTVNFYDNDDRVEIVAQATTDNGEQELVFEV
jgi:hypothetical protein